MTRTLTFVPAPTVEREAVTKTTVVGNPGFYYAFNHQSRPLYRFTLQIGPLLKTEAECLSAIHAYLQGVKFFLWDGGPYGAVTDYVLAGVGDGARTSFYLPNRHIGPNSITVRTLRPSTGATSTTAAYSLYSASGVLLFNSGTAPASGDEVQAKYGCQYLVNFAPDGITTEQVAHDLYQANFQLVENPDPISTGQAEHIVLWQRALTTPTALRPQLNIRVPLQHIAERAYARFGAGLSYQLTAAIRHGRTAVTSGAFTLTISTGLTNSAYITMVPEWNTTYWVTSLGASQANVEFGTATSSGGSYVNWGMFF